MNAWLYFRNETITHSNPIPKTTQISSDKNYHGLGEIFSFSSNKLKTETKASFQGQLSTLTPIMHLGGLKLGQVVEWNHHQHDKDSVLNRWGENTETKNKKKLLIILQHVMITHCTEYLFCF